MNLGKMWSGGALRASVLLAMMGVASAGCGGGTVSADTDAGPDGSTSQDGGAIDATTELDMGHAPDAADPDLGMPGAVTTYLARHDMRRCPAPACGGLFLSAVNQAETTCADGTTAAECYVAALDWTPSGLREDDQTRAVSASGGFLFDGQLAQRSFGVPGALGVLLVEGVWIAEWGTAVEAPSDAAFHGLARTPLLCLIDPCFNIRVDTLNSMTTLNVSDVDLSMLGASLEDVQRGEDALQAGTLRATGVVKTDSEPGTGGFGETYHATQFYVPLPFPAPAVTAP